MKLLLTQGPMTLHETCHKRSKLSKHTANVAWGSTSHDMTSHDMHHMVYPMFGKNVASQKLAWSQHVQSQMQGSKVFLFHDIFQSMKSLPNKRPEWVPIVQVTHLPCPPTTKAGLTSSAQSIGPHPALALRCWAINERVCRVRPVHKSLAFYPLQNFHLSWQWNLASIGAHGLDDDQEWQCIASSLKEKHKHPCSSDFCFAAIMLNKHANHHMHVTTFHAKTVQTCVHACYIFLMVTCSFANSLSWLDACMHVTACHGLMLTLPCLFRFCPCVWIHATAYMAWCSLCHVYWSFAHVCTFMPQPAWLDFVQHVLATLHNCAVHASQNYF